MKICLLTRRFDLRSGGIGRVASELRERLSGLGHNVISVSTDKEDLVNYFEYVFWGIKSKIPDDCDVYHAITPMESIWIPKGKSVATILDIIPITHPEKHGARMGGNKVKYTIGKWCFDIGCRQAAKSAVVACISDHVRDEYERHFGVCPLVIRLGIRDDLEPKENNNSTLKIGYLGQVDRRKRVDALVEAFLGSRLDAELLIGGDGIDRPRLQQMAKNDGRVKFLGFLPDEDIAEFYNSLDLFVFPTAIEGYGLPPVEAMACRKPVVVMRDAIIPQDVKSRCVIADTLYRAFESHDAIQSLIGAVDYDANYRFAKSHDWNECVSEYLKLYEEILG